ncbi:hypothetical protein L4D00_15700 [Photobacterium swingsii]|uniref:hypothetical protein n=1 Tax=Photobacterium swingsii TaxID=680026 RepID=UPI003D0CE262
MALVYRYTLTALLGCTTIDISAKEGWELSAALGMSYSLAQTITVKQNNQPDLLVDGQRESKPFSAPFYYALRVGFWWEDQAIELEGIHHKIYVEDNLPPPLEKFEITDGYNLLYLNYAYAWQESLIFRAGIGSVIAHPDIIIAGERTLGGYQFSGLTGQVAIEKEFALTSHWLLSLEGKLSYSQADIDINNGSIDAPDTAFHLIGHIKYNFGY